jgi:hypothetical protein
MADQDVGSPWRDLGVDRAIRPGAGPQTPKLAAIDDDLHWTATTGTAAVPATPTPTTPATSKAAAGWIAVAGTIAALLATSGLVISFGGASSAKSAALVESAPTKLDLPSRAEVELIAQRCAADAAAKATAEQDRNRLAQRELLEAKLGRIEDGIARHGDDLEQIKTLLQAITPRKRKR